MKKRNKGFSLIELIIVIAIMAVLVAIIAPNLSKYLGRSKENTDTKNIDEIKTIFERAIAVNQVDAGNPLTVNSWITFDSNSVYYDTSIAPNSSMLSFAQYISNEIEDIPKSKTTGNYFQVKIVQNADDSYEVEVKK